jgi:hypothetical protein
MPALILIGIHASRNSTQPCVVEWAPGVAGGCWINKTLAELDTATLVVDRKEPEKDAG